MKVNCRIFCNIAILIGLFSILILNAAAEVPQMADSFGVNDANGETGNIVQVPIEIVNTVNGPIQTIIFNIDYNESVISLESVDTGPSTLGWAPIMGADKHSITFLTFSQALAIPDGSTGIVGYLNFQVLGSPGATSLMTPQNIDFSNTANQHGTAPAKIGTFSVSGCTYSISPTSDQFGASGGTGIVSVTSPCDCGWSAMSNDAWITVTSGDSGSGSGTVGYSVDANPSSGSRTGTMTVAGETFTVNQDGINHSSILTFLVTDKNTGLPVEGATIQMKNLKAQTDNEGKAELSILEPGIYSFAIRKVGYIRVVTDNIIVNGDATIEIDLLLKRS